jgi:hypothetical protein
MEVAPPPPLAEYEPVLRRKLASRMQSRISLVKAQTIKKYRVVIASSIDDHLQSMPRRSL